MITGHAVVDAIGQMHFEGNILPHSWFQCEELRYDSGKPNVVAILLLADVIYWYRPNVRMSEATGQVESVTKRFRDTMLHKDYALWAVKFGFTKRQVQDAVKFLRDKGIVRTELRDLVTATGARIYNATFIEPIPAMIHRITFEIDFAATSSITLQLANVTPPPLERDTSPVETGHPLRLNGGDTTFKRNPCTETTYENKEKEKAISKKKSEPAASASGVQSNGVVKNHKPAATSPKLAAARRVLERQPSNYRTTIENEGHDVLEYVTRYHPDELATELRKDK